MFAYVCHFYVANA